MDNTSIFRGILIIFFIGVLIFLVNDYTSKQQLKDKDEGFQEMTFHPNESSSVIENSMMHQQHKPSKPSLKKAVVPNEPSKNEDYKTVRFDKSDLPKECFPKDKLTAEDLLPKDAANSKWAQVNPAGQGDLKDKNFLNAGAHIGINTVGNSLRNPNLQLRSEPPNPQVKVSPWNQTSIESDLNRRPLEIGGC